MTDKAYRSELTPVDFLRRSARVYPDKTAVIHGRRRYSYAQFAERAARLASGLHAAGFVAGDRVAILSPNAPALLEAHFAVPAAGGVLVPINTRLQTSEIDYILSHSGARFLFVDEALYPQVADLDLAALELVRIADSGETDDLYERFLAAAAADPLPRVVADEESPLSMNYTSGTTGPSKGVLMPHGHLYLFGRGMQTHMRMTANDRYYICMPLFHAQGILMQFYAILIAGGSAVLGKQFRASS